MSDIDLMVIYDAARVLCGIKNIDPDGRSSVLYFDVTNHEFEYVKLSRKYKAHEEYSEMEQRAIDKVKR